MVPKSKQKKTIGKPEIEEIIAKIARIPARNVSSDDRNALKTLDRDLKATVFGQDKAIEAFIRHQDGAFWFGQSDQSPSARSSSAPPVWSNRSRAPARVYSGGTHPDMSEYMERHAVSRLIGAHPDMSDLIRAAC